MLLNNRRILLVGSEGRLGKRWKNAIQEEGGRVVGIDIQGEPTCNIDIVNTRLSISELAENIHIIYGHIDGLVIAAALNPSPSEETADEWDQQFSILKATREILKGFGTYWISRNIKASVVLTGSDLSLTGPDPDLYKDRQMKADHYTVVKHAVVGLTRHYATLFAKHGIRVNCLCPGAVETSCDEEFAQRLVKKIPMNRLAEETEYDGAITFLLSDVSSYMTGSVIVIDGGRTCW